MIKKRIINTFIFIVMLALSVSFLYPLFFMLINSFKTNVQYETNPFSIPKAITLSNYVSMISQFPILRLFANTLVVTVGHIGLLLFIGMVASFGFAQFKFRSSNALYLILVATMLIPGSVVMIPQYVMFAKLHLINNFLSVIIMYVAGGLPGAIMLMTANFKGISGEMIEAGRIDGCGYFQTLFFVVAPQGMAAVALVIIYNFIGDFSDLFIPMIFLSGQNVRTIMVALTSIMGRYGGEQTFQLCGLLLSSIPVLIVYAVFQKYIVKGIAVGSFR